MHLSPSLSASPIPHVDAQVAAVTNSVSGDRGVIHQVLTALGVGSSTAHDIQVVVNGPSRVVVILVIAFVVSRLVSSVARRLVSSLRLVSPLVRTNPRGSERIKTLTGAVTTVFRSVIWVIALLECLGALGVDLAPFVATATVIGAAVGFGAQSLIKDFLSGVLILAEDQYEVGDSILIQSNQTSGTVEGVNLRTTRVRGDDGTIWYVPNGDIRTVGNNTETDSNALVDLVVPSGTDLAAVGRVAEAEAAAMADDPVWRDRITRPPVFLGVQDLTDAAVTLRLSVGTTPAAHWAVRRELRLRVLERIRSEGLAWAST